MVSGLRAAGCDARNLPRGLFPAFLVFFYWFCLHMSVFLNGILLWCFNVVLFFV